MKRILIILLLAVSSLASFAQKPKKAIKKLGNEPVFFIDSVAATQADLQKYQPTDIATVSVYKDQDAIDLVGADGKDGVVFIQTKSFTKRQYQSFFKSKSKGFADVLSADPEEIQLQYILNDRILTEDFEGDLGLIDASTFKELKIIDTESLKKDYNVTDKKVGVLIRSDKPEYLYKAKKKF